MRVSGRANGVSGDPHAAVSTVLEAHRHREARGELAVYLAFCRARTNRAPRDSVGEELREDGIEELAASRHLRLGKVHEQLARQAQPLVDSETPLRCGSLINPFHPTVVRGFSKYTRITMQRSRASSLANGLRCRA